MRVAVLSDIHGNLTALEAVLAAAQDRQVDQFWIVGDLVALGPQPAETLERLRHLSGARIVRGNTDRYVTAGDLPEAVVMLGVPETSDKLRILTDTVSAHSWTRGCVTAAGGFDWLAELPVETRSILPDGTRVLLVHAAPGSDDGRGMVDEMADERLVADGWTSAGADLIFVGHTHRPVDRTVDSTRIVNVGSVSLPVTTRGVAMWTLLVATADGYTVERCLAPYDLAAVAEAIDNAHHPTAEYLRRRLLEDAAEGPRADR